MRVLHVIPSLDLRDGGPSVALPLMARSLAALGVKVDVVATMTVADAAAQRIRFGEPLEREGFTARFFKRQTGFYKVSFPLRSWVRDHARDYDIIHIHAIFSFAPLAAARAARHAKVAYIIRPLGLLNSWGMENRRRLLKSLSFRFLERPVLRHAAAMHYTASIEQMEAEHSGATAPAAVIPLGIDVSRFATLPSPDKFLARFPQAEGRDIVLFLSRVDPKKGLDLLLPAFAGVHAKFPKSLLVIAGSGDEAYVDTLRARARELGIDNDVVWTGFLDGGDKLSAFAAATVFTLPSYSENFGIAVVEALAAALPCVTTEGVAVSGDIREQNAGLVVAGEVGAVAAALEEVLGSQPLRVQLGASGRRLAQERFSLEAMGAALKGLYQRILSKKQTS